MSTSFLAAVADHPLVADGAMGTALRALLRDEEDGANLELLCLTRPELVRQVHGSYLAAGADLLQTNTYGANSLQFDLIQRPDVLVDVNRRAVDLAREAAATVDRAIWIAGSVGPLGAIRYDFDVIRTDSIAAVYGKQMVVLKEAGVDLIVLETMDDYREIVGALRAATKLGLTVMLQLACPDGETVGGLVDLSAMVAQAEDLGAAIIGANCRLGPRRMVEVADRLVHLTRLPVSIQPNAGTYVVDRYGRLNVTGDVAEYQGMAERCLSLGVRIIGGCCYTSPAHIQSARAAVDAWMAGRTEDVPHDTPSEQKTAVTQRPRRSPSKLERALADGKFLTCVEIDPPTAEECRSDPGILGQKIDGARYLEQRCGVDVITIADHTMGQPWLDPFPFAEALRPHLHTADMLLHYSCRNKAETDITGNFASYRLYGYKNILIITGDRPAEPETKSFFVYSSPTLIERVHREQGDYFFLAASFDHTRGIERGGTFGLDAEVRRLRRKVEAGARLALTQPVFLDRLDLLREKTRDLGTPIFPGVMPIMSVRHAQNLNSHFPGMHIPHSVIARLESAGDDRRKRAQIAVEVATETARAVKATGFPGVYLIMSLNRFDVIKEVMLGIRD